MTFKFVEESRLQSMCNEGSFRFVVVGFPNTYYVVSFKLHRASSFFHSSKRSDCIPKHGNPICRSRLALSYPDQCDEKNEIQGEGTGQTPVLMTNFYRTFNVNCQRMGGIDPVVVLCLLHGWV